MSPRPRSQSDDVFSTRGRNCHKDFMFAPYLGVFVTWIDQPENVTSTIIAAESVPILQSSPSPPSCLLANLMADPDIITSDNITIIYQQAQLPLATFPSTTRSVPSIATDILIAEFLDDPEYWVDEISVRSDQDFSVKMKLNTSQTCTNQYTGKAMYVTMTYSVSADNVQGGATYSYDLAYLKGNQRMYCVSLIEIETSVQNTADTPPTFALQTTVIGCKIDPGKTTVGTCNSYDLLRDGEMENRVTVKWLPVQDHASQNLYTTGERLQVYAAMNPSISVTSVYPLMLVKQLSIEGNVFRATVITEGYLETAAKQTTSKASIVVDFNVVRETSQIDIIPLQADSITEEYYNFTLKIVGCIITASTASTPTPVPSVTPSSPSASTISTPGTSTFKATNPSQTATTTMSPTSDSILTKTSHGITVTSTDTTMSVSTQATPYLTGSQELTSSKKTGSTSAKVTSQPYLHRTTDDIICCRSYCRSNISITQEQIEERIEALIADLTIPKHNISALKRKKGCAKDTRPSAIAVGTTCGIVCVIMAVIFILLMDVDHVIAVIFFVRMFLKKV